MSADRTVITRLEFDVEQAKRSAQEGRDRLAELRLEIKAVKAAGDEYKLAQVDAERQQLALSKQVREAEKAYRDYTKAQAEASDKDPLKKLRDGLPGLLGDLTGLGSHIGMVAGLLSGGLTAAVDIAFKAFSKLFDAAKQVAEQLQKSYLDGEKDIALFGRYEKTINAVISATKNLIKEETVEQQVRKLKNSEISITEEQMVNVAKAATLEAKRLGISVDEAYAKVVDSIQAASAKGLKPLGVEISNNGSLLEKQAEALEKVAEVGRKTAIEVNSDYLRRIQRQNELASKQDEFNVALAGQKEIRAMVHGYEELAHQAEMKWMEAKMTMLKVFVFYLHQVYDLYKSVSHLMPGAASNEQMGKALGMLDSAPKGDVAGDTRRTSDQIAMNKQLEEFALSLGRNKSKSSGSKSSGTGDDGSDSIKREYDKRLAELGAYEKQESNLANKHALEMERIEASYIMVMAGKGADEIARKEAFERQKHTLRLAQLRQSLAAEQAAIAEANNHKNQVVSLDTEKELKLLEAKYKRKFAMHKGSAQDLLKLSQQYDKDRANVEAIGAAKQLANDKKTATERLKTERKYEADVLRANHNMLKQEVATAKERYALVEKEKAEYASLTQGILDSAIANMVAAKSADDFAKSSLGAFADWLSKYAIQKAAVEFAEGMGALGTTWGIPNPSSIAHFGAAAGWTVLAAGSGLAGGYLGSSGSGGVDYSKNGSFGSNSSSGGNGGGNGNGSGNGGSKSVTNNYIVTRGPLSAKWAAREMARANRGGGLV